MSNSDQAMFIFRHEYILIKELFSYCDSFLYTTLMNILDILHIKDFITATHLHYSS